MLYAPHVRAFSETHGEAIARAGYHCRDYLLAQPERFAGIPLGVLADGTHVRGLGTYDQVTGVETCRIAVTLASGTPQAKCHSHGLGWRDLASIDPVALAGNDRLLVVERAGEVLYRLRG